MDGFWMDFRRSLVGMRTDDPRTTARLPVAMRIARVIQEKIARQEYQSGEWLPTEREFAREFNADRSTIRTAMEQLAEQQLIVREPGRRPWVNTRTGQAGIRSEPPQQLSSLQTIAAIIPQPRNYPALSAIQRGILLSLRNKAAPYRLVAFDNQGDTWAQSVAQERAALDAVEHEGITGALLWPIGGEETFSALERLQQKGTPMVLLDRYPEDFACDFVGIDNRGAAREAVSYLLSQGHRRIAHLTSHDSILTVREREEGYCEALRSQGVEPSQDLILRVHDRDDLYPDVAPVVDHFLSLPEPPTALFVLKDLLAHAFIREAEARGIRIPEDISVIGFDDHDRYALQTPRLTTVHQPFETMGKTATELLLRRIARRSVAKLTHQHIFLPTPLVIRSTCGSMTCPSVQRHRSG